MSTFVPVVQEEVHTMMGQQGGEDVWMLADVDESENGERDKPKHHHGAEGDADFFRAEALHEEKAEDDAGGDGHDVFGKARTNLLQSFHGGQHGDRRGDHAVAVKQAGSEHAGERNDQHRLGIEGALGGPEQGEQGKHAALPLMGGMGDEGEVFEAHHRHQGPEHQRDRTQHTQRVARSGWRVVEALSQRVERTGADVPKDHSQSQQGQGPIVSRFVF